jgi:hypothetical protein
MDSARRREREGGGGGIAQGFFSSECALCATSVPWKRIRWNLHGGEREGGGGGIVQGFFSSECALCAASIFVLLGM